MTSRRHASCSRNLLHRCKHNGASNIGHTYATRYRYITLETTKPTATLTTFTRKVTGLQLCSNLLCGISPE